MTVLLLYNTGGKQSLDTTLPLSHPLNDERQVQRFEEEGGPPSGDEADREVFRSTGPEPSHETGQPGAGRSSDADNAVVLRRAEGNLAPDARAAAEAAIQRGLAEAFGGAPFGVAIAPEGGSYAITTPDGDSHQATVISNQQMREADPHIEDAVPSILAHLGGKSYPTPGGGSFYYPTKEQWATLTSEQKELFIERFDELTSNEAMVAGDRILVNRDSGSMAALVEELRHLAVLKLNPSLRAALREHFAGDDEQALAYLSEHVDPIRGMKPGSGWEEALRQIATGEVYSRARQAGEGLEKLRARSRGPQPSDADRIKKTQRVIVGAGHLARGADTFKAWSALMREKFPGITDKQLAFDWREVRRFARMDRKTRAEWITRQVARQVPGMNPEQAADEIAGRGDLTKALSALDDPAEGVGSHMG